MTLLRESSIVMTTMTLLMLRVLGTNVLLRSFTSKTSSVIVTDHITRKHSIRMLTARLQTVRASVAIIRCRSWGGWQQMWVAGLMWGGGPFLGWARGLSRLTSPGGTLPCELSRDVSNVPAPPPIPTLWTERRLLKHYLPATSSVGGISVPEIDAWCKENESAWSQCTKWTTR